MNKRIKKANETTRQNNALNRLPTQSVWRDLIRIVKFQSPSSSHAQQKRFYNWQRRPAQLTPWAVLSWVLTRKSNTWRSCDQSPQTLNEQPLQQDGLQVCFIGHATVLIKMGDYHFLTDPVWCDYVSHQQGLGPKRHRPMGMALDQLPKIDAVLLSHNHYDHMDLASLAWLHERFKMPIVTGLGNAQYLPNHYQVIELDWWQSYAFNETIQLVYTPAQHGSGRGVFDQNKALWGGFSVLDQTHHCYFAGDTGYAEHFHWIRERLGAPTIACLPIGAYEPRRLMQYLHMNPEDALQAHQDLAAEQSLAMHYAMFQLTDEEQFEPVHRLRKSLAEQLQPSTEFHCLQEGQWLGVN